MKILYDSQIFGMQDYGGISRYFYEIMKRLDKKAYKITPFLHNNHYLNGEYGYKDIFLKRNKYRNFIYTFMNIILGIPGILSCRYKIFHPTYYEDYFLPFISKKKLVITVHDLIHEKFIKTYPQLSTRVLHQKEKLIRRADHIIAVSNNTKKDIVNIYGVTDNKISVVYHGNSLKKWDGKNFLKLPDKYILFVGQRWLYKNFDMFIKAMSLVIKEHPEYSVISAGGGCFTVDEKVLIKKLGIENKVQYVSFKEDRDLAEIYARSTVFVYPSLYEGFGIPILEAFSEKTSLALSNTSCFPEIAGDAAIYFDPKDKKSISSSVIKLIENRELRNEFIKRGTQRLKLYSWDKAAVQTMKVYNSLS